MADWWSFGICLFELATGNPPFMNKDLEQMQEDIRFEDLPIKKEFSKDFANLLLGLTNKNPHKRLGIKGGASQIKNHKFFSEVNWDDVKNKKLKPPIVPQKK